MYDMTSGQYPAGSDCPSRCQVFAGVDFSWGIAQWRSVARCIRPPAGPL